MIIKKLIKFLIFGLIIISSCEETNYKAQLNSLTLIEYQEIQENKLGTVFELLQFSISFKLIEDKIQKGIDYVEFRENEIRSITNKAILISADKCDNPEDWITKDDLKKLIHFVESKEKAIPFCSGKVSYNSGVSSTVGANALFLIGIYRKHNFWESNRILLEEQDKLAKECINWWSLQNQ